MNINDVDETKLIPGTSLIEVEFWRLCTYLEEAAKIFNSPEMTGYKDDEVVFQLFRLGLPIGELNDFIMQRGLFINVDIIKINNEDFGAHRLIFPHDWKKWDYKFENSDFKHLKSVNPMQWRFIPGFFAGHSSINFPNLTSALREVIPYYGSVDTLSIDGLWIENPFKEILSGRITDKTEFGAGLCFQCELFSDELVKVWMREKKYVGESEDNAPGTGTAAARVLKHITMNDFLSIKLSFLNGDAETVKMQNCPGCIKKPREGETHRWNLIINALQGEKLKEKEKFRVNDTFRKLLNDTNFSLWKNGKLAFTVKLPKRHETFSQKRKREYKEILPVKKIWTQENDE